MPDKKIRIELTFDLTDDQMGDLAVTFFNEDVEDVHFKFPTNPQVENLYKKIILDALEAQDTEGSYRTALGQVEEDAVVDEITQKVWAKLKTFEGRPNTADVRKEIDESVAKVLREWLASRLDEKVVTLQFQLPNKA